MHSLLSMYASKFISPEQRVAQFIADEKRLTWVSLFLEAFPSAQLYIVGGTTRDAIRGEEPNDIDLVVRGVEPAQLEKWLLQQGSADFVGRFGTFKFIPHGCGGMEPIDIALPRTEHIGGDHHGSGRRDMEVKFDHKLAIEEDLGRRDFTINAIAYDIRTGHMIDPFLGMKDLDAGLINAVLTPSDRFYEDATRMLRGLRLAAQLNFGIEEHTWNAMKANIHLINNTTTDDDGNFVYSIPREAVGKEFILGFTEHPQHTLRLWSESGALHLFLPELTPLETEHKANFTLLRQTELLISLLFKDTILKPLGIRFISSTALVAGLLAHLGDEGVPAKKVCVQWHFHQLPKHHDSYVSCDGVYWLLKYLHLFETTDPSHMRPSEFERIFVTGRGAELLALMQAYYASLSAHHIARERVLVARRIRRTILDVYKDVSRGHVLPQLLNGSDLQELGIEPGPQYRELFDELRDLQLTGEITTKKDARKWVESRK